MDNDNQDHTGNAEIEIVASGKNEPEIQDPTKVISQKELSEVMLLKQYLTRKTEDINEIATQISKAETIIFNKLKEKYKVEPGEFLAIIKTIVSNGRSSPKWKDLYCDHMAQIHNEDVKQIELDMKKKYPAKSSSSECLEIIKQGEST
jgi:hypothetical protein